MTTVDLARRLRPISPSTGDGERPNRREDSSQDGEPAQSETRKGKLPHGAKSPWLVYAWPMAVDLRDTEPEAAAILLEGYRRMSAAQKFAIVDDLRRATLQLAAARIRAEAPDLDEREIQLRVAELTLGRELVDEVRRYIAGLHGNP